MIIKRFDDLGRIHIPKEIREKVFSKEDTTGEPVEIFIKENQIVLQKYDTECEWHFNLVYQYAKSECGFLDTHRIDFVKMKYCPYCGKQMKIIQE